MAQGKKTDEQTLEVARAYLATGETVAAVARRLSVPESTVRGWRKRFEKEDAATDAAKKPAGDGGGKEMLQHYALCSQETPLAFLQGELAEQASRNFAELRAQKKREMIERAWRIIEKAQAKVERDLDRAIEKEKQIDNAITLLGTVGSEMSPAEVKATCKVLRELKIDDIGKLSTVMGTMYDKQALAMGDATENVGVAKRFEDM